MMPPDEKAMELMLKYYNAIPMNTVSFAKKFALIAVDEILKVACDLDIDETVTRLYWKKVKQYIIEL